MTAATGLLALAAFLYGIFDLPRQQREASLRVEHTLEVLGAATTLDAELARAVISGRGFIIVPEPGSRARTEAAEAKVAEAVAALRALIGDNAEQQKTIDRVQVLIDARLAVLHKTMDLKAAGDQAGLGQAVVSHAGRDVGVELNATMESLRAEERRRLDLGQRKAATAMQRTVVALIGCAALAAMCGFTALTLLAGRKRERAHLSDLRRTEALLRAVLQTASGPIYAKDLHGRLIAANAATTKFFGKSWPELEGRTDRENLADPAQGEAIMENDRQVIAEGKTQVLEEHLGAAGERPRIWLSTKTPMRDADGAIVGMVGMSVDITDRKRAEERLQAFNAELEASVAARTAELAASEARQRAYFDHSPIGMVVMRSRGDGAFVLEDLNPAARTAFGFAPDSAPGLTQSQLWPELVARDKQRKMQLCASDRKVFAYSVAREIGGEVRLLDIALVPLPDHAAATQSVLICVQDVTAQRALERQVVEQAERQLEAAERETALFMNSPDELFVVRVEAGPDGPRFVYEAFSPVLEAATGLSPGNLIGRSPDECLRRTLAQTILATYRRCLQEQTCIKFTATRQLPVGQRDVEGSVSPVRHPVTGRINRLVGAVRDVTERNRMEAALRQGQKMEAIGRLAAGVAHDFNNILQAIIGSLDLVIDEAASGTPTREFAGTALNAAMRGSHLTHHLLSYARKQILWPQTIDLAAFLPEIETLLRRTLGPHIAIQLNVEPALQTLADPGELQTALLNLAINGAHAMPKGGILRVSARSERTGGRSWVGIAVTDTGAGMDAATLAQAVEPFFTTKGVNGTGLGLSMVQGFAEQSGGTLNIASTPGRGTSVALRLPATTRIDLRGPAPAPEAATVSGRILLVDDSTDILVTVGAFLQKAGFSVVRTENGERALAILAADRRFDALVSDYAMPGLNGLDLIAQARLLEPGLPALIITGYAAICDADAAAEGAAVLHKPFHRRELLAALLRVMGRDAPATAPAERATARRA